MNDMTLPISWHDCCLQAGLNPNKQAVVMAVSGGADSMAMAHILYQFWKATPADPHQPKFDLRALIVDHGIRSCSAQEAALTAERLTALGISNRVERITAPAPKTGVQAWARDQRYRALWREASRDQAAIVTGHHLEDQAETLMMRLSRGSGLRGLIGMRQASYRHGVTVIRPFLNTSKQALRDHLAGEGIGYVDDPSNDNPQFERVRWRQHQGAFDALGFSAANLMRLSASFAALDAKMMEQINALKGDVFDLTPMGVAWIDHGQWQKLPQMAQVYLLGLLLQSIASGPHPASQDAVERLAAWCRDLPSSGRTLGGVELTPKRMQDGRQLIWLYPEAERPWPAKDHDQGHYLIDGRWHLSLPMPASVRPLGEGGFADLKKMLKKQMKTHKPNQITPPHLIIGGDPLIVTSAPARAFWRLPLVTAVTKTRNFADQEGLFALEDGAMIPHVNKRTILGDGTKSNDAKALSMCFIGSLFNT